MEQITLNMVNELKLLFELSPPAELRQHLTTVFFQYLNSLQLDALPPDFKEICESFHFLLRFLQIAEKNAQA